MHFLTASSKEVSILLPRFFPAITNSLQSFTHVADSNVSFKSILVHAPQLCSVNEGEMKERKYVV